MFAHISLGVNDMPRALKFYDAVMLALGHKRLFGDEHEGFMAYGPQDGFFIINTPLDPARGTAKGCNGSHFCFTALSPAAVDDFYKAALENGATDGGAPGLRPHYSKDYYAAFVIDPDGHKLEAMARASEA